jgi:hypothetical protein
MKSRLLKKTHMRILPIALSMVEGCARPISRQRTRVRLRSSIFARLASEIFLSSLHRRFFGSALVLLLIALATLGAAPVDKKVKDPRITVSTHLDKTAIWVGDTLRYTVRAVHDRDIEFVLDSLKKDSLNLAPFVVREVAVSQNLFDANKEVTEVTLQLATYETGQTELNIPSFVLYYFARKAGAEKSGDMPAESFPVPATRVGLRSTLTGDARRLRDSREILPVNPYRWMSAFALGFVGLAFLGVQTARRLWSASSTEKPKTRQLTRHARGRVLQDFLRTAQSIGRESREDQLRYYSELSRFIREYLGQWLETDAVSLTPEELARVLEEHGKNGLAAPVRTLLVRCEQVLYTRQGAELGRQWRDEVQSELGKLAQRLR